MSTFQKAIFIKFDVNFLIFTIYHSQIDEQNERINRIVEIIFKYAFLNNFESY